jgi:hypothetical protein
VLNFLGFVDSEYEPELTKDSRAFSRWANGRATGCTTAYGWQRTAAIVGWIAVIFGTNELVDFLAGGARVVVKVRFHGAVNASVSSMTISIADGLIGTADAFHRSPRHS